MHWANFDQTGTIMMIFMMIFSLLFLLVFIAAIVIGAIYLVRYLETGMPLGRKKSEEALEVAKQRYARGEISKEEFEQLKRDLT